MFEDENYFDEQIKYYEFVNDEVIWGNDWYKPDIENIKCNDEWNIKNEVCIF